MIMAVLHALLFKVEICVNVQAMVPDVRYFRSALPFKDTVCRTFIFDENERVQMNICIHVYSV